VGVRYPPASGRSLSARRWAFASCGQRLWHSVPVRFADPVRFAVPDDPRGWDDIPFAPLVGIVIGLIVVWAAIRYMVRKK